MNNEKIEKLKAVLYLIGWILLNICLIWIVIEDYINYCNHKSEYTVYEMEITGVVVRRGSSTLYFEYEVDGERKEGYVLGGITDEKGKKIKIAFDKEMNYIRPEIVVCWGSIVVLIMTILNLIGIIFPIIYGLISRSYIKTNQESFQIGEKLNKKRVIAFLVYFICLSVFCYVVKADIIYFLTFLLLFLFLFILN